VAEAAESVLVGWEAEEQAKAEQEVRAEAEERERQERAQQAAQERKLDSVQALAESLGAADQAAVAVAVEALRRFADDDDQRVAQAAKRTFRNLGSG
jgi:hypothetical protein